MSDLVIHAGELIHKDKALALMMKEFTAHGYSETRIKVILERAVAATQSLLRQISDLPEAQKSARLEWALRADAQAAEHWRSQWTDYRPQVSQEDHAARMARYRRDRELQEQFAPEWEQQELERRKRYKQEQEEQKALLERAKRQVHQEWMERKAREHKARLQNQFDAWEAHNQYVQEYNEAAPLRAAERQREDEDRKAHEKARRIYYQRHKHRILGATDLSDLDLPLSDHDYIEWRFRCASNPNRRYLAECPIVRPAI